MGIPRCSWLICCCSTATLPLPHNCGKSHTRSKNLRQSGVQASSPHLAHSHTHGPHCPWHEQTHMHFTQRSSNRMQQSTVSNRRAPPGNPAMDKTARTPQTKPHRTTLSHTRTRPRSILRPMRHPQEDRPPDSPPRVVIPKPPAILIPQIPITSQD